MEASLEYPSTMDAARAQALLKSAAENLGHGINVFLSRASISGNESNPSVSAQRQEEYDDFYDFTEEDYFRMLATKKTENFLKTKKIRDAEAASRRARITNATIRVQFPDNYILEAKFQPSDTLSSLVVLVKKAISRTDLPFYLYTTPPKQRLQDLNKDFYTAGLAPGALVYFSYDIPRGVSEDEISRILASPYLRNDVVALRDLHLLVTPTVDAGSTDISSYMDASQDRTGQHLNPRSRKSGAKPKWMKL